MEHSGGLSASDVLALTRDRDDDFGGNFWWVIVFLIVAAMFGGNGWGFGNNSTGTLIGEDEFIKRDIFNTNQNVSNTACQTQRDVLETKYADQLGTATTQNLIQSTASTTDKEILQNRYENSLQTNTLQSQMSQCCCDLRAEGLANTQKILDKMAETEINNLRERLNERDRELQSAQFQISQVAQTNNITNTLRPFPQPAYLTASPYQSYYGFGNYGYAI